MSTEPEKDTVCFTSIPKSIVVFGAGIEAVNGVYTRVDNIYEMKGPWKNQEVTFSITTCGSCMRWHLNADGNDFCFYASNPVAASSLPPCRNWWISEKMTHESFRPPIIFYGDEKSLDWRMNPSESLADYKIEIVHKIAENRMMLTEYNVHKHIVANASKYFLHLFTGSKDGAVFEEKEKKTSRIELDPPMANLFPNLLDYMYWLFSNAGVPGIVRPLDASQHVAMFWHADYFEVTLLLGELQITQVNVWDMSTISEFIEAGQRLGVQPLTKPFSSVPTIFSC
jgi:hypothetical protein